MAVPRTGLHLVRRPFDADGRRVSPGDVIDVTGFKNAYQLHDRGYIVDLPVDRKVMAAAVEKPASACSRCGASGSDPCRSATGKPTLTHSGRTP